MRQTVRTDKQAGWLEQASALHCFVVEPGKEPAPLGESEKEVLLRGTFGASVRTKPEPAESLVQLLVKHESDLANELRRPTERELRLGVRHAVTPLFGAIVS
jgi:hypothetical protein